MFLKQKQYFLFFYAVFATQVWAGPGSTTDDLMSQFNTSPTTDSAPIVAPPGQSPVQPPPISTTTESCPTADLIEQAHANELPFGRPWVVFNNPELLSEAFKFEKTLNKILDTAPPFPSQTTEAELLASLFATLNLESAEHPASGLKTPLDRRNLEAEIPPQAAVDNWFPVGVFNRLDTAPQDGGHCGEYRIVYANSLNIGLGRFFTIFEAAIPNPGEGIEGCLPIAKFWASLADPELTDEQRVIRLEKFFYDGIEMDSVSIDPAIRFNHYSGSLGQVRTNQFIDPRWQLREFKTALDNSGNAVFAVETVKSNVLTEFYDMTSSLPSPLDNQPQFVEQRGQFQSIFIDELIEQLTSADGIAQDGNALINSISMVVPNDFNEFRSDSSFQDNIMEKTGVELKGKISDWLVDNNIPLTTQAHISARAEAMSCGGCHQNSNNAEIGVLNDGTVVNWPPSSGFVHIDESGNLSPALENVFLPARETVLKAFVCTDDDCTAVDQMEILTGDTPIVEASGTFSPFSKNSKAVNDKKALSNVDTAKVLSPLFPTESNLANEVSSENNADSSRSFFPSFSPWKAFDGQSSFSSLWVSAIGDTPAWISYEWDSPRKISEYSITHADHSTLSSLAPKDWELQGWDGTYWITLDSRSNETNWEGSETRTYDVSTPDSYQKYRLHFTDDNVGGHGILAIVIGDISFKGCDSDSPVIVPTPIDYRKL